jgi:hypothetical protein
VAKFPVDAPKSRVVKAPGLLGFRIVREREHIAMLRGNADGSPNAAHDAQPRPHQKLDASHHLYSSRHPARRVP